MTNYTITNIHDLDDAAKGFGLSPNVEARFGRKALAAEKSGFSYQKLAPNLRQPFGHKHAQQEEIYVFLSGSGRAKLGNEVIDLKQWDALRVAPATERAFEGGADGLEYLVFGSGESGDAETIDGFWPPD